jgi:hypothetical protein
MDLAPAAHGPPSINGKHISSTGSAWSALAPPSAGSPHSQALSGSQQGDSSQAWFGSQPSGISNSPAQLSQIPSRHGTSATPVQPQVQFLQCKPTPTEAATVTCTKCRVPSVLSCCMKNNGNLGRWFYSWCEFQEHRSCQSPCRACCDRIGTITHCIYVCMIVRMGWFSFCIPAEAEQQCKL